MLEKIAQNFTESIQVKALSAEQLPRDIISAVELLTASLARGNKVLACGNGGSACDAEHFTSELVNRFQIERIGLAAISLNCSAANITCIANDDAYTEIFSRQVQALGRPGDVLLVISTSGNSQNVLRAVEVAHEFGLHVVALTGKGGGSLRAVLHATDVEICVPHDVTARIQEIHILVIHCLCELIDQKLFA